MLLGSSNSIQRVQTAKATPGLWSCEIQPAVCWCVPWTGQLSVGNRSCCLWSASSFLRGKGSVCPSDSDASSSAWAPRVHLLTQELFPATSCPLLRVTCTWQVFSYFPEESRGPLALGLWSCFLCCWALDDAAKALWCKDNFHQNKSMPAFRESFNGTLLTAVGRAWQFCASSLWLIWAQL